MTVIWVTRGRDWGFRFLRDGDFADPLPIYEAMFSAIGDAPEAWHPAADQVAVRFPDPLGRKDRAGRVIPHDFVAFGPSAESIKSVEDGRQLLWPEVAEQFARVWKLPKAELTI